MGFSEMKAEAEAGKEAPFNGLPLWGGLPPARPLSPTRRPKMRSTTQRTAQPQYAALRWLSFMISLLGLATVWFAFSCASLLSRDQEEIRTIGKLQRSQEAETDPGSVVLNETQSTRAAVASKGVPLSRKDEGMEVHDSATIIWMLMKNVASNHHMLSASDHAAPSRTMLGNVKFEEVGTVWSQSQLPASSSEVFFRDSTLARDPERPTTYKLQWWTHASDLVAENMTHVEDLHLAWIPAPWPYELRWRISGPQPYELRWRQ